MRHSTGFEDHSEMTIRLRGLADQLCTYIYNCGYEGLSKYLSELPSSAAKIAKGVSIAMAINPYTHAQDSHEAWAKVCEALAKFEFRPEDQREIDQAMANMRRDLKQARIVSKKVKKFNKGYVKTK